MPHKMTSEEIEEYINSWRENFLAKFANLPKADFSDNENTTVIHGNNDWATCYRHACYLAKYIYKLTGSKQPDNPNFYTEYQEKMDEVEEHWEEWDFVDHKSGLMGALFKQKGYDPQSEKAACPPTLVFRGTDFEDFRGLAALVRFRASKGIWWTILYPWIGESGIYVKDWDREDFIKDGYTEHLLYHEESIMPALFAKPFGFDVNLDIKTRIELYIYTKGGFGDWNNNFTQGMGKGSEQYKRAIEFGEKIVEERIIPAEDKRLMVTGHSLGGGLAAATCCVLNAKYPSLNFHSIIFNAAGVHKNTIIKELESEDRASGAMGSNPCFDICVQDEILTSLGVHYKKLPFLGAVFTYVARHIGQHGLPNPTDIAVVRDIPGYSPGTMTQKSIHQAALAALPDHMKPILAADTEAAKQEIQQEREFLASYGDENEFHRQVNKLNGRIKRNNELAQKLEKKEFKGASETIGEILEAEAPRQNKELEEQLKHAKSILAAEISPIEMPAKGAPLKRLFPIQRQNAVAWPKEDGFPLVTMMDNHLQTSYDVSTFLSRMLAFLNQRYGKQARKDSWVFWGSYEKIFERFWEDLKPEFEAIEILMGLSSEYHGMDIVIASYEKMLLERTLPKEQKQQIEQERQLELDQWQSQEAQRWKEIKQRQLQQYLNQSWHNYKPSGEDIQHFFNMRF